MTPMVDLFSLLLTFFMLTATIRPQEPAPVDIPLSISEKTAPDKDYMTVVLSKDDRVFFTVDNGDTSQHFRAKLLMAMGKHYNVPFTQEEVENFEKNPGSFGVSMSNMKKYLDADNPKERQALQTGMPIDSTDDQLAMWILYTRQINPDVQTCIKGDGDATFPLVKKVLDILQDKNVNRFNLITNLEKVEVKENAQ